MQQDRKKIWKLLKIVANNDNYVQGYFEYDSKKSGGVTRCHIRLGKKEIRSTYYVENPSLVVVTKEGYVKKVSKKSYAAGIEDDTVVKKGDYVIGLYEMNTLDTLLLFKTT